MRAIRTIKRADDMPMIGSVLRKKRGVYVCVLKFMKSKRVYMTEEVCAPNQKRVKELMRYEHPHIKWSKR